MATGTSTQEEKQATQRTLPGVYTEIFLRNKRKMATDNDLNVGYSGKDYAHPAYIPLLPIEWGRLRHSECSSEQGPVYSVSRG